MLIKLLILMLLCHVLDDFYFQGCLANLKQRTWWLEQCAKNALRFEKYKHDYIMSLFMHSMEWSIVIMLPLLFIIPNTVPMWLIGLIILINTGIHMFVDDLKANKMKINLVQDQIIHLIQIIITIVAVSPFI